MVEAILSDAIRYGYLKRLNGEMLKPVPWFTTDPRPHGHGLTNGKETLSQSGKAHAREALGYVPPNYLTHDKTKMRITVDVSSAPAGSMESFVQYCIKNESYLWAKWTGLTGIHPHLDQTDDKTLKRLYQHTQTKERTWWLSWQPIPATSITAVDISVDGRFVPYSFEGHGRVILRDAGFVIPDAPTLQSPREILPPGHDFEVPKALLLCHKHDAVPTVAFRGALRTTGFEISTGRQLAGAETPCVPRLQAWIRDHEEELLRHWSKAMSLFKRFDEKLIPDQRAEVDA